MHKRYISQTRSNLKVLNIHNRIIDRPIQSIADALGTLSKENDRVWPFEKWPAMRFKEDIGIGAKGGHGPIKYTIEKYNPTKEIQFRFTKPKGFDGIHKLELKECSDQKTEIIHTIDIKTSKKATLQWLLFIRQLHNALIEDAFDKLENNLTDNRQQTQWNLWVKTLRYYFK